MSRDGLTQAEAVKRVIDFFKEMEADWKAGGDLSEWEHTFMSDFALEPDYFEDFVLRLC